MSLEPSVRSDKLHPIVVYVLSNLPSNSVGDTVVFRIFALLFITFWNQREIEFCWDSLYRVSVLYPFHNFFVPFSMLRNSLTLSLSGLEMVERIQLCNHLISATFSVSWNGNWAI